MTAPSNANTSELEVVAWLDRGGFALGSRRPSPNAEPLVTAASAQARIAELEAEIAEMIAERSRRSVAWQRSEARADRLAKALEAVEAKAKVMIDSHKLVGPRAFDGHPRFHKAWAASRYGDGKEIRKTIRAAIQQEIQP